MVIFLNSVFGKPQLYINSGESHCYPARGGPLHATFFNQHSRYFYTPATGSTSTYGPLKHCWSTQDDHTYHKESLEEGLEGIQKLSPATPYARPYVMGPVRHCAACNTQILVTRLCVQLSLDLPKDTLKGGA